MLKVVLVIHLYKLNMSWITGPLHCTPGIITMPIFNLQTLTCFASPPITTPFPFTTFINQLLHNLFLTLLTSKSAW
uniref:Uncharacterized protein n=2 Tax=Anguilla anguilla TaxID=7936 RepID=A0A0E9VL05_ANGAN